PNGDLLGYCTITVGGRASGFATNTAAGTRAIAGTTSPKGRWAPGPGNAFRTTAVKPSRFLAENGIGCGGAIGRDVVVVVGVVVVPAAGAALRDFPDSLIVPPHP